MSISASKALLLCQKSEVFETVYFIDKVDKFYDCLNVSNFVQRKHSRKPYQEPYCNATNEHLKVCT